MKKSKKVIIGVLATGLVAAVSIGGTLAFLTDSEKQTNTFTVGDLDISLSEPNWNDTTDGKDMTPGNTLVKDPTVAEVVNDSYMRVVMTVKDSDGNKITDTNRLNKILAMVRYDSTYNKDETPVTDNLKEDSKYSLSELATYPTANPNFTLNTTKSTAGEYYYEYNSVFTEGDEAVLFTNVVVPTDYNQTDLEFIGQFKIEVYAQAIQTDNFTNSADAFTALDAEIANGTIQENYGTT